MWLLIKCLLLEWIASFWGVPPFFLHASSGMSQSEPFYALESLWSSLLWKLNDYGSPNSVILSAPLGYVSSTMTIPFYRVTSQIHFVHWCVDFSQNIRVFFIKICIFKSEYFLWPRTVNNFYLIDSPAWIFNLKLLP